MNKEFATLLCSLLCVRAHVVSKGLFRVVFGVSNSKHDENKIQKGWISFYMGG